DLITLGETPADYDKHFILVDDIDLDPSLPGRKVFDRAVIAPNTDPGDPNIYAWPPFTGVAFTGVLNGRGHTISHLTVRGKDHVGLFGQVGSGGEVENLGVVAVNIAGSSDYVGGLVGENDSGTLTQCYSTGAVSGGRDVGGLVGANTLYYGGNVTHCYTTCRVSGDSSRA
ncbi:MAG: hypothetical protein FJ280_30985, partial [Planctomycetes bacterium]|nr:hypothetical protein [Planctomycetota bacterium]